MAYLDRAGLEHLVDKIKNRIIPISKGGTGKTTATAALTALGGAGIKKLWTNASIGSDFGAQTITLPSSTATHILILDNHGQVFIIPKDAGKIVCYGCEAYPTQRSFTYTNSKLVVSIGEYLNSGWKTGNSYLKPWQIFALEGVK